MIPGFGKQTLSIGSHPGCDVVLQGAGVAPEHARLINQGSIAADVNGAMQFLVAARIENQGTVRAEAANSIVTIRSANFTNTGTVQELNGGKVLINP